jgi:hypothetical protein
VNTPPRTRSYEVSRMTRVENVNRPAAQEAGPPGSDPARTPDRADNAGQLGTGENSAPRHPHPTRQPTPPHHHRVPAQAVLPPGVRTQPAPPQAARAARWTAPPHHDRGLLPPYGRRVPAQAALPPGGRTRPAPPQTTRTAPTAPSTPTTRTTRTAHSVRRPEEGARV